MIDFGMYGGGPPAGDLALINFTLPDRDLEDVLTGYSNPDPEFRRAIDLHTIGLAIGHLAHHASIGDDRGIHDGAATLQATLRRL